MEFYGRSLKYIQTGYQEKFRLDFLAETGVRKSVTGLNELSD
ncbi:MAG: hypothetical protein AB7S77_04900 [Desulfatirhabdiaceae bacterium]